MDKSLATAIHQSSYLTGQFTLRSGATSTYYFDKYQFEADPSLLKQICEAMIETLPEGEFLAGVELGGMPIATLLSQLTGRPTLFVRKKLRHR
ncbi:MAG: orotate phosphoribosyltransferase [Candidatus Azotimanducaceae bacterium]|jgi:orotate phosphoribosyltransferase